MKKYLSIAQSLGLVSIAGLFVACLQPRSRIILPEDQVRDVSRHQEFHFELIFETEIAVQLDIYDLKETAQYDLASLSPQERKAYQSKEPANAVLTLQKEGAKRIMHTAGIDANGRYRGYITLAGHQKDDYVLGIHKPGHLSRKITIENLIDYARIDRTIPMVSLKQVKETDPDTIDSDGDSIPNIYDAFPHDPKRAFRQTQTITTS